MHLCPQFSGGAVTVSRSRVTDRSLSGLQEATVRSPAPPWFPICLRGFPLVSFVT